MCHHFHLATTLPEDFVLGFGPPQGWPEAVERAVVAAYPLKPVAGLRAIDEGLESFVAEWGLLPRWWKPSDKTPKRSAFQRKTFNARSETAATKPTFRDAMKRRRCLLPVAEFFEKDHYFGTGEPMSFAGLWESWLGDDGEVLTATLLTTEPNAEVQGVGHHRMPVLLTTPELRAQWLERGETPGMFEPLADGVLGVRYAAEVR